MLGLGLRSTQSPGVSSSALASPPAVFLEENFSLATNVALSPNPYEYPNAVQASLTGWAFGSDCVSGVSVVAGDPTSTEGWGTMTLSDSLVYNAQAIGWQSDSQGTSSTGTGPSGEPQSRTNNNVNSTSIGRYIYTEGTAGTSAYNAENRLFIARTPGVNFNQSISNTSNDIKVSFQAHGFGQAVDTLKIFIDDAATSTEANCALVYSNSSWAQTESASPWTTISFVMNSADIPGLGVTDLRTTNSTFYLYLTHQANDAALNDFQSDLSIDNFYIEEVIP